MSRFDRWMAPGAVTTSILMGLSLGWLTASSSTTLPSPPPTSSRPSLVSDELVPVTGGKGEIRGFVSADALRHASGPSTRVTLGTSRDEYATDEPVGEVGNSSTTYLNGIPIARVLNQTPVAPTSTTESQSLTKVEYFRSVSVETTSTVTAFGCTAPKPASDSQYQRLVDGMTWTAVDGQSTGPLPRMCGLDAVAERPAVTAGYPEAYLSRQAITTLVTQYLAAGAEVA
jgi:hypothetical protein